MAWYNKAEIRLVKSLMENWQRRGSQVLHLGLHSSVLPEFFWDSGLDVTVCEENHLAIETALKRSGPRISYQVGKADYLPFEDDSFEYAFFSLYACSAYCSEYGLPGCLQDKLFFEKILPELCRVAQRSVIILAKNSFSLNRAKYQGTFYNPYTLWRECNSWCSKEQKEQKGRVRFVSTGFVPRFALRFMPQKLDFFNCSVSYLPFGALIGYNLTFNAPPVTGIGEFIKKEQRKLGQVSCIQRNSSFADVDKRL